MESIMKTLLTTGIILAAFTSATAFANTIDNQAKNFINTQATQVEHAIANQLANDIRLAVKTFKMPIVEQNSSKRFQLAKSEQPATEKKGE